MTGTRPNLGECVLNITYIVRNSNSVAHESCCAGSWSVSHSQSDRWT